MLFLSAQAMARLGFVSGDDEIGEIARRWVDRPAPNIQSGAAGFAAMMSAANTGKPADLRRVRVWFDFLLRTAATSTSLFATPLAAAYLAEGETANAGTLADALRATVASLGDPPLHLASHHQITAMIAHAERDGAATVASASCLIDLAVTEGFVLLQVDGLELLAVSTGFSEETNATILAAVQTARDKIGYRGRWPNLDSEVTAATDTARRNHPAAYELGASLSLSAACALTLAPEAAASDRTGGRDSSG
jgi:hypothetical protein